MYDDDNFSSLLNFYILMSKRVQVMGLIQDYQKKQIDKGIVFFLQFNL